VGLPELAGSILRKKGLRAGRNILQPLKNQEGILLRKLDKIRRIRIKVKCQMNNPHFLNIELNSNKSIITINYSKAKKRL